MLTNTLTRYIGGVANSVTWLAENLRAAGHRVLIIAPEFDGAPEDEIDVLRIPALQRFGGSDFSVPIPLSRSLDEALDVFQPDIVHSHQALRMRSDLCSKRSFAGSPQAGVIDHRTGSPLDIGIASRPDSATQR
ncbi:glycosyltransferase family 4 protein [Mesorhizobium sp. Root695]|uniref:glycosyltransferase family 4 protein n=1 Tax=Mesorhizobium sp. Root695 TaxID=1736589 RepID=UPI0019101B13|nr:glycosyltransferase family 4 protein [Mesorhizobium sp. Root695]